MYNDIVYTLGDNSEMRSYEQHQSYSMKQAWPSTSASYQSGTVATAARKGNGSRSLLYCTDKKGDFSWGIGKGDPGVLMPLTL